MSRSRRSAILPVSEKFSAASSLPGTLSAFVEESGESRIDGDEEIDTEGTLGRVVGVRGVEAPERTSAHAAVSTEGKGSSGDTSLGNITSGDKKAPSLVIDGERVDSGVNTGVDDPQDAIDAATEWCLVGKMIGAGFENMNSSGGKAV